MDDRLQEEVNKTVDMLPQALSNALLMRFTNANKRFHNNFIVYKCAYVFDPLTDRQEQMVECHCTSCDEIFFADKIKAEACHNSVIGFVHPEFNDIIYNNDDTLCPYCGNQVTAIHISSISRYAGLTARDVCATIHNVNNHLVMLTWIVEQYLYKNANITYTVRRNEGIILIKNKAYRVTGHQRYFYNSEMYFNKWVLRKRYDETIGKVLRKSVYCENWDLLYNTDSSNCALREYIYGASPGDYCHPGAYLRIWSKYTNVENLVKQGYTSILESAIEDCYNKGYSETFSISLILNNLNLKKAKPHEILEIDKSELPIAKQCNIRKLAFYRLIKNEKGICLSDELLQAAERLNFNSLTRFFTEPHKSGYIPPVVRTINYLNKQKRDSRYLIDYWNMLYDVYDTMPPELIFPKELIKAHDNILTLYKAREERIISEKIRHCAENNSDLCFTDDETGLFIRPAQTQQEFINEGKQLHHCVATYAKSVANGNTLILFIRKVSTPDQPYYTLEYNNSRVLQNRGLRNCDRTEDVIIFEKKWLDYLKSMKRKGVKKCVK